MAFKVNLDFFKDMTPEEKEIYKAAMKGMSENIEQQMRDALLNGDPRKSPDFTWHSTKDWTNTFSPTGEYFWTVKDGVRYAHPVDKQNFHPPENTGVSVTHRSDGGIAEVTIYPEKEKR